MKKQELIKLIEMLPDDAEIVVVGDNNCDILGDYSFNSNLIIEENTARSDFSMTFSNYSRTEDEIKVWVIK